MKKTRPWVLCFDGACGPINPGGVGCYGWVLYDPNGDLHDDGHGVCGEGPGSTNNVAEFMALIEGLKAVNTVKATSLICRGDSKLVVQTVMGKWRCKKPHLQKLCMEAKRLLTEAADVALVEWMPREQNTAADALSRQAHREHTGRVLPEFPRKNKKPKC